MARSKINFHLDFAHLLAKAHEDFSSHKDDRLWTAQFIVTSMFHQFGQKAITGRFDKYVPDYPQYAQTNGTEDSFIIENYQMRFISSWCQQVFRWWREQSLPLVAIDRIPTPLQMLDLQKRGGRYISVLWQEEFWKRPHILGKIDPLDFCLHDIHHAFKFYENKDFYYGQIAFYDLMSDAIKAEGMNDFLDKNNPEIKNRFDYIIADMNGHPVHLIQTLKSLVWDRAKQIYQIGQKGEMILKNWLDHWNFSPDMAESFLRVGDKTCQRQEDGERLHHYLVERGRRLIHNPETEMVLN